MISLQRLIQFQFLYYVLAIAFNATSILAVHSGHQQLTPNDPYIGSLVMTIYVLFLLPGLKQKVVSYRILMGLAVIFLGYGGVYRHYEIFQQTPELYSSLTAAIIGPGINAFGLMLNLIAVLGFFRTD